MRTVMLTLASAICLLGCTSPQEQARKQQAEMDRMMAEFGPACTQLGYTANSDPWRNCVVQLAAKNDVRRGSVSTSIFGSWGSWGRGSGVGVGIGMGH
jgi:hypothetical protein